MALEQLLSMGYTEFVFIDAAGDVLMINPHLPFRFVAEIAQALRYRPVPLVEWLKRNNVQGTSHVTVPQPQNQVVAHAPTPSASLSPSSSSSSCSSTTDTSVELEESNERLSSTTVLCSRIPDCIFTPSAIQDLFGQFGLEVPCMFLTRNWGPERGNCAEIIFDAFEQAAGLLRCGAEFERAYGITVSSA